MRKLPFLIILFLAVKDCRAQKADSLFFHLYTDSLKKGFYNYINVDAKMADGRWQPLSSADVDFIVTDPRLRFTSNDLFIDSTYTADRVTVKAVLKKDPSVWREVTIYIRKRGFDEPLRTTEQILHDMNQPSKKGRRQS